MKAKKIIIVVVAILIILGGTFAGLWFFTDVFNFLKPDKKTTSENVANTEAATNMEKALHLDGTRFANYSDFLNKYKDISEKSCKSKVNMTANLKLSSLDSNTQNIINKSKITLDSNTDIKNNRTQNKIGLYSNNSEVLTLDLVTNDTKFGIGATALYDKYLSFSLEDLLELIKQTSGNSIDSDSLESLINSISQQSSLNLYDLFYISEEDLQHFDETYRDGYKSLISAENYSTKEDVDVKVNGKNTTTTAYYLTLTGKDLYNFINDLGGKIKDDSVLSRLITEKMNLILGNSSEYSIEEDDVKSFITELVDDLVSSLEDSKDSEESAVQIAVYSVDDNPVRIDFNNLDDAKDLDNAETILSFEFYDTKNSDEETSGTLKISADDSTIATIDYTILEKEDEEKLDILLKVPDISLNAGINMETTGNYQEEEVAIKGSINLTIGKESAEINFDGTVEYTDDVSVPELTSSNSIDILKMSEEELNTEVQKIVKKASEVLPEKLKLIGIDVKAEDIYKDPNAEQTQTTPTEEGTTETPATDAETPATPAIEAPAPTENAA